MSKNNGGPAFPARNYIIPHDLAKQHVAELSATQGMTLRDYFAGEELSKTNGPYICDTPEAYARLADHCYRMADAMLAERAKERT